MPGTTDINHFRIFYSKRIEEKEHGNFSQPLPVFISRGDRNSTVGKNQRGKKSKTLDAGRKKKKRREEKKNCRMMRRPEPKD